MKILIIGSQGAVGRSSYYAVKDPNDVIIFCQQIVDNNTFYVNGVKYSKRNIDNKSSMLGSIRNISIKDSFDYVYKRSLSSDIDIVKEFTLIQNKKSDLKKWERDEVVRIFNRDFMCVD